jgi:hypothetical protein
MSGNDFTAILSDCQGRIEMKYIVFVGGKSYQADDLTKHHAKWQVLRKIAKKYFMTYPQGAGQVNRMFNISVKEIPYV